MTKEKLKFVFPNIMAKFMKKVDMRTQMEASMMSTILIMTGMTIMVIYLIIYGQMGLGYKSLIIFNLLCGFVFISSFLVTTYHQYLSFMEISGIDPDKEREAVLKKGNIFKRIKLAIKNKKKKPLQLVNEAIDNMVEIKQDELKAYKKIEVQANQLIEDETSAVNNINKSERR